MHSILLLFFFWSSFLWIDDNIRCRETLTRETIPNKQVNIYPACNDIDAATSYTRTIFMRMRVCVIHDKRHIYEAFNRRRDSDRNPKKSISSTVLSLVARFDFYRIISLLFSNIFKWISLLVRYSKKQASYDIHEGTTNIFSDVGDKH